MTEVNKSKASSIIYLTINTGNQLDLNIAHENPIIWKNSSDFADIQYATTVELAPTVLHLAAAYGNFQIVKQISESILNILPQDSTDMGLGKGFGGYTPLHYAAREGHLPVVQYFTNCLLEKNPSNDKAIPVMHTAAAAGQLEIVEHYLKILPQGQKNPFHKSLREYREGTPLHFATIYGHLDVVQAIKQHVTNINPGDSHKVTPLHLASRHGYLHIVEYFVSQLENISPRDDQMIYQLLMA